MAPEERTIDSEIMNLNGGLFETAPSGVRPGPAMDIDQAVQFGPAEVIAAVPVVIAEEQVRRPRIGPRVARRIAQLSGIAAAVVLGVGLAAASQLPWGAIPAEPPPAVAGVEEPDPAKVIMFGEGVPSASAPPARGSGKLTRIAAFDRESTAASTAASTTHLR